MPELGVALKFCGSCNPEVELGPIARRLRELLSQVAPFVPLSAGTADVVVILNACPIACADRPEVRSIASRAVGLNGHQIDGQVIAEEDLAGQLAAKVLGHE